MKHIKQLAASLALILFIISPAAQAQSRSKIKTIEQLEDAFSIAFMNNLTELDAKYPNHETFRVIIEYSSALDPDIRVFRTFGALGRWLKSRETEDGFPWRLSTQLVGCKRGVCTFEFEGNLQHNRLYIQKLSYGYRNGRPYLKTIFLLAG
jgi:hypothetical protein